MKTDPNHIILLDNEQPTTCPKCGVRTEFADLSKTRQIHSCPNCRFEFIGEFE